ncbi:MAG TPA: ribosomal protein S18-alanine N-acetyltransferase [Anaerolineae bacterium]
MSGAVSSNGLPYKIAPMRWEDVPAVMAIEHRSFTLPWSDYTYRHEILENNHSHYIVVWRTDVSVSKRSNWWTRLRCQNGPGKLVGYGGFWLILDEAHISTIASHPDWRGRGLGEFLLGEMIEQAIGLGASMITLEVRVSNTVAKNLYHKYGFVIVGRRPRYYRDNNEDADLMTVEHVNSPEYRERLKSFRAALDEQLRQTSLRNGRKTTA